MSERNISSNSLTPRRWGFLQTSKQLAIELARLATQIREQVKLILTFESRNRYLHELFENFKAFLTYDLTINTFADMYAQTITYNLFFARVLFKDGFTTENISTMIPDKNHLLGLLFEELTRIRIDPESLYQEKIGVSALIRLLKTINIERILQDIKQQQNEDPVLYFYELFLKEYSPKKKIKRGVFYTPSPIVFFIVRSVDYLLRTKLGYPNGLADDVAVLDPATGTGVFLTFVIAEIKKTFNKKHKGLKEDELIKKWSEYVSGNLLPRLFGFEMLLTPYTVAHLKIAHKLAETGYDFKSQERFRIYLTNALELQESRRPSNSSFNWLTEENRQAQIVKTNKTISIILGNPPYSISSQNKGKWINELVNDYKKNLKEKKINLDADFIKFIRFAQWKIDQTDSGILAFVINHTFIDALTHRRMRESLLKSFDEIYILDLHGNAMKQEKAPGGRKDENVFDIQQGVTISIFIKSKMNGSTKVYHSDIWGYKDQKYAQLLTSRIDTIQWAELTPSRPNFFFVPKDFSLQEEYNSHLKIDQVFKLHSYGIQTKRDKVAVAFTIEELKTIIHDFIDLEEVALRKKYNLPADGRDWQLSSAKKDLTELGWDLKYVAKVQYRPFDYRYIYYFDKSRSFIAYPRFKTLKHMLSENLGLICMRQVFQHYDEYNHFGVANTLIDERTFYSNRGGTYLFPLYIYDANKNIKHNFSDSFIKIIEAKTGFSFVQGKGNLIDTIGPKEIFQYLYSLFYSREYRKRYSEFLKISFPGVLVTSNKEMFSKLSKLGKKLISLHLFQSSIINDFITTYEGDGENLVQFIPSKKRLLPGFQNGIGTIPINDSQYFRGVPQKVWEFNIGGYQICHKWLKYRKNKKLTRDEIIYFQKIVVMIKETLLIMKKIEELIDENGGGSLFCRYKKF
ncbi:MAG: type ISP restriction/modification enzyme [Candidatus Hermodarchaeota archaeon]